MKLGFEERLKNGRLQTEAHIHGEQEDLKVAQESFAAKLVWSMRNQYQVNSPYTAESENSATDFSDSPIYDSSIQALSLVYFHK